MSLTQDAPQLLAPIAPWFETVRRELPWRAADLDSLHPDPYAVLVSELMLQQTQVATVIPYYQRWMEELPDVAALALVGEDRLHKLWEGLGYYRRARFLQAAGLAIHERGWPRDLEGLLALPGLGPYTAAALASIAFQRPEPALDGNAFRVLARLLGLEGDPRPRAPELRDWLRPALRAHGPSRMTQAIMELGATCCSRKAQCRACPLLGSCRAQALGLQERIPAPVARAKVRELDLSPLALEAGGHFLVVRPSGRGLLAGLWSWPLLDADEVLPSGFKASSAPEPWTQVYTHRRERVSPRVGSLDAPFPTGEGRCWVSAEELRDLPMGSRDQRIRSWLLDE
nr:hypothetical protein [uncultured Holophaga sp.]